MPCRTAIDATPHRASRSRRPSLLAWLRQGIERQRQRRELAALDSRLLRDIGLTAEQARAEAAKPFWKP